MRSSSSRPCWQRGRVGLASGYRRGQVMLGSHNNWAHLQACLRSRSWPSCPLVLQTDNHPGGCFRIRPSAGRRRHVAPRLSDLRPRASHHWVQSSGGRLRHLWLVARPAVRRALQVRRRVRISGCAGERSSASASATILGVSILSEVRAARSLRLKAPGVRGRLRLGYLCSERVEHVLEGEKGSPPSLHDTMRGGLKW